MTGGARGPAKGRRPSLRTIMSAALCRAHYAIALVVVHLDTGPALALSGFAAMEAWAGARAAPRREIRLARRALFLLYMIFYSFTLQRYLVRQWQPLFGVAWPAGAALFGLAFALAAWRGRTRLAAALVWGAAATGWILAAASHSPALLVAAGAATLTAALMGLPTRAALSRANAIHLACTIAAALLFARLAAFYFYTDAGGAARYSIPGAVEPVYSYAPDDAVKKIIGNSQVYSLTPGCRDGMYFLTTRKGRPGLIVWDQSAGRAYRIVTQRMGGSAAANRIAKDCEKNKVFFALYDEGLVNVLDVSGSQPRLEKTIRLGQRLLLDMAYSPKMSRLFITDEYHSLHILDTSAGERLSTTRNAGKYLALNGRSLVFVAKNYLKVFNIAGDAETVTRGASARNDDGTDQGAVSAHPHKPLIYVNGFLDGRLCERRLPDLREMRCAVLCPGVRFTAVAPDGRLVASVDNIHGRVFFVDTATMRVISEHRVGPRARDVTFSLDGRYAFVPSAAGGFRIKTP